MSPKVRSELVVIAWTFFHALCGSVAGGSAAMSFGQWDWRASLITAAVATLTATGKALAGGGQSPPVAQFTQDEVTALLDLLDAWHAEPAPPAPEVPARPSAAASDTVALPPRKAAPDPAAVSAAGAGEHH